MLVERRAAKVVFEEGSQFHEAPAERRATIRRCSSQVVSVFHGRPTETI